MRVACILVLVLAAFPLAATTVVCLGDSLTAGYGLTEDQAYPAVVERLAQADGRAWRVVNAGVSGDTTAGGLRRLAWALKAKPDILLLALGANDGLRGVPVAQTKRNLGEIVERAQATGARVLVAGMQLPTNYGADFREAFAAVFPAVATAARAELLPFLLAGVGGDAALNQADGIHPNADGQQRIAALVYAALKPLVDAKVP
ncbi:MAG: arylesterase [Planctomycetes bacterium]|nr:arylesterase [Planctomycetota bacterium]